MADQIPRILCNQPVLQLKPSGLCFALMLGLCVLAVSIHSVQATTCPPSAPSSSATTTDQCSFTGYNTAYIYGVASGPVSKSLYYMYLLSSPTRATVRKVDASGSQIWVASFAFDPNTKSLSVDAAEQSVYLACYGSPLVVLKLAASDGSIISQHQ